LSDRKNVLKRFEKALVLREWLSIRILSRLIKVIAEIMYDLRFLRIIPDYGIIWL